MITQKLKTKIKKIKLLILDVDGVLTNNLIYVGEDANEFKNFCVADGIGIRMLLKTGVDIAVISGRNSKATKLRMSKLGVKHIFQNQNDKLLIYNKLINTLNLKNERILVVGDDLPDIPIMKKAGVSIAVRNAYPLVKSIAQYVTKTTGGAGAVREICELIMKAQNTTKIGYQLYL